MQEKQWTVFARPQLPSQVLRWVLQLCFTAHETDHNWLAGSGNAALMYSVFGGAVKDLRVWLGEERIPDGWEPKNREYAGHSIAVSHLTPSNWITWLSYPCSRSKLRIPPYELSSVLRPITNNIYRILVYFVCILYLDTFLLIKTRCDTWLAIHCESVTSLGSYSWE
jgi:hypothetical protein